MKRLDVRREAKLDILEIVLRYEQERDGLGWEFDEEIGRVLERVQESPQQFPEIEPGVRRALLDRFPYAAYFADDETVVTVLAVYHLHRHPDAWKVRRGIGGGGLTSR
jgi:plasmid stabilization system protein ParE